MREIKFRAWDKLEKKMYDSVLSLHWLYGQDLHEIQVDTENGPMYIHKFILMQYIGLEDKNGKEIYEGDIVKTNWDVGKFCELVFWVPEISGFKQLSLLAYKQCKDNWIALSNYGKTPGNGDAEVIGNIYENPELLKEGWDERTRN